MVGQRWGTEERAADQGGGGSTFLLYLRLLLNLPSYIHTPTLANLHTFFFDYLPTYFPSLYFQRGYLLGLFISLSIGVSFPNWFLDKDTVRGENYATM